MKTHTSLLLALASLSFTAACGGGTTGSNPYETLDSTAAVTSTLAGTTVNVNETDSTITLLSTSGSLTHDTGAVSIDDGIYSFVDSDGMDTSGVATDGNSVVTADGTQGFEGSYDYVIAYEQSYTTGGKAYSSFGVGGIVTAASDVPTSGTATYYGEAEVIVVTSGTQYNLTDGQSSVYADFGAAEVDVVMDNFTALDTSNNPIIAPIDNVELQDMNIVGNVFQGGLYYTGMGSTYVDVLGTNQSGLQEGNFFGYDTGLNAPDEVAGTIVATGDDGLLVGQFIAD